MFIAQYIKDIKDIKDIQDIKAIQDINDGETPIAGPKRALDNCRTE